MVYYKHAATRQITSFFGRQQGNKTREERQNGFFNPSVVFLQTNYHTMAVLEHFSCLWLFLPR